MSVTDPTPAQERAAEERCVKFARVLPDTATGDDVAGPSYFICGKAIPCTADHQEWKPTVPRRTYPGFKP